ncbi:hypothetical protein H7X87_00150, partial [Acetobacteraceae bacterium]|nr:hypothetical protein [Candidatus Parcubacteria bacterium]
FIFSFWPFAALAVVLLALSGNLIFCVVLGITLDLVYGVPVGIFHIVLFPFTLLSLISIFSRLFMKRYMLSEASERLQ